MKSKYKGRVQRTSGWESQTFFDNEISHMDVSSLKFLKFKYNKEIKEFPLYFDMNADENQQLFKEMLQRKHMIDEELEIRLSWDSPEREEFYDSETETVLDKYGNPLYTIALDEDESEIVYIHSDLGGGGETRSLVTSELDDKDDDEDDPKLIPIKVGSKVVGIQVIESTRSLKDIYKDWNYQEDIHEEENW